MKRFLTMASLMTALALTLSTSASAAILFSEPVDLDFTSVGGTKLTNVVVIGFQGTAISNHSDPGLNGPSNGDPVRSVAGLRATDFTLSDTSNVATNAGLAEGLFDDSGVMFDVTAPDDFQVNLGGGGDLSIFLSALAGFSFGDPSTWGTGTLAATFAITSGNIEFKGDGIGDVGTTTFIAELTSNPDLSAAPGNQPFITLSSTGLAPDPLNFFATLVSSQDQPAQTLFNDAALAAGTNPLTSDLNTLFPGFSTGFGGATEVDVSARISGSQSFALVPEPSSMILAVMGGMSLCGLGLRRRKNSAA